MPELSHQISALVEQFVADVTALSRKAAMDSLSSALGTSGTMVRIGRRGPAKGATPSVVFAKLPKGAKRPADELAKVRDTVLEYVTANPGKRVEHMKAALGLETRELSLPIKKLIAEGSIRAEGHKRSTTYHPASG